MKNYNNLSKEKLIKRKENLLKMKLKIKKHIKVNKKREIISLKYAKHHYSD